MSQIPQTHWTEKLEIVGTFPLDLEELASPGSKEFIGQDPFGVHIGMTWGHRILVYYSDDSDSEGEDRMRRNRSGDHYRLRDLLVTLEPMVDFIRTEYDHIRVKIQILQGEREITDTEWHDYPYNNKLCVLRSDLFVLPSTRWAMTLRVNIMKEKKSGVASPVALPSAALLKKHFTLVHQNLTAQKFNDIVFFLYRRQPADDDDTESIGKVYANKDFLVGVSEHFALCEFSLHPI
jgi:hypothetical protein